MHQLVWIAICAYHLKQVEQYLCYVPFNTSRTTNLCSLSGNLLATWHGVWSLVWHSMVWRESYCVYSVLVAAGGYVGLLFCRLLQRTKCNLNSVLFSYYWAAIPKGIYIITVRQL